MFTSNVSITSRDGHAPLVSTAGKTVSLDQLTAGTGVSGSAMGADPLSPAARDAMSRIFDLVAQMEGRAPKADRDSTQIEIEKSQRAGREALADKAMRASMTKDDAMRYLLSDDFSRHLGTSMGEQAAQMRAAVANGTATIIDLEEKGVRSEVTYTVHFNEYGGYRGGSRVSDTDIEAYRRFREDNSIRHPDGTMTDRTTGQNAAYFTVGPVQLYVTWP
ncbi:MAG: hypothetical protein NXH91_00585 [Phyllobacteriaceae bacterium]|jgi:hypothetical protein|nr:hypothetical protein [Phyllobacteriaceae bacterium]